MQLNVSGEVCDCPDGLTVQSWMEYAQIRNPEVALIQVNFKDILRQDWAAVQLNEGDRIDVLYFLGDS